MNTDDLSARLQQVIFRGGSDQQMQRIIDEFVDSDEERKMASEIQEDLLLAYTLAKQERGKVMEQLLIGCFIFLLSLGATIYTLVVIQRISLWICGALVLSTIYSARAPHKVTSTLGKLCT